MQKDYLRFSIFIALLCIISSGLWMSVSAEPDYEAVRDLLLAGNLEASIALLEKEPILDKNQKIRLGNHNW